MSCIYNGKDGIKQVRYGNFDAVILDVMLLGMDGFTVLKEIRQFSSVPVLMLTAKATSYQSVESDCSRQTGGTGLDLAIVKICVEACQGKVSARNIDPHSSEVSIFLKNFD